MSHSDSLQNKIVLLTRASEANAGLATLFEQFGARTVSLPMIEIADPDSWNACDEAIINLRQFNGILFTSKNAVEKFLSRINTINPDAKTILANRLIYAIGEKTETALEEAGIPVTMTPEVYSAEDLAKQFRPKEVAGKQFLFPKSNIAREILPNALRAMDAVVDEVVVYKTISPNQNDLDGIRNAIAGGGIDVVTFFSPSSVRNFVQIMGKKCAENTLIAVIGQTTAGAARDLGMPVHLVAKQSTEESLVETIAEYFANRSNG